MNLHTKVVTTYLLFLFSKSSAWGVLVATPDSGNPPNMLPSNGAPWENVLFTNDIASSVYLGNGWVLTAEHVFDNLGNSSFVTHNSVTYFADPTKIHTLNNPPSFPGAGLTAQADLVLFQLNQEIPSLQPILLGSSSTNLPITMIGFGGGKSWGTNSIENTGENIDYANPSDNDFVGFTTDYDTEALTQAQGIIGDSGGAAFAFQDDQWKLVGIMLSVDTNSTPNITFFADLNSYSSQINTIIPEPSSTLLASTSLLIPLRRKR